ncbi:MAG TPA: hypothetical protein VI258_01860 [Rhodanobacteraceae bacterium]
MAPPDFPSLLSSIREVRHRILAMSSAEAMRLYPTLATEAARICEGAGVTDENVQRFAADILDEAVRRRYIA